MKDNKGDGRWTKQEQATTTYFNLLLCVILALTINLVSESKEKAELDNPIVTEKHLCDDKVYTLTIHQFADQQELESACTKAQLKELRNELNQD